LALKKYTSSQSFIVQTLWIAGFTAPQISRAVSSVGLMPMTPTAVEEFTRAHVALKRRTASKEQRQQLLDSMRKNRADGGILGAAAFQVVR
jgi:hypothetical protein